MNETPVPSPLTDTELDAIEAWCENMRHEATTGESHIAAQFCALRRDTPRKSVHAAMLALVDSVRSERALRATTEQENAELRACIDALIDHDSDAAFHYAGNKYDPDVPLSECGECGGEWPCFVERARVAAGLGRSA